MTTGHDFFYSLLIRAYYRLECSRLALLDSEKTASRIFTKSFVERYLALVDARDIVQTLILREG